MEKECALSSIGCSRAPNPTPVIVHPTTRFSLFIDPKISATGTSIFATPEFLSRSERNIQIVQRFTDADIIVVNKSADLSYYTIHAPGTPLYLSTFEPYYSFEKVKAYPLGPSEVYLSNCYNGEGLPQNLMVISPYFPELAARLEPATFADIESKWGKKNSILCCMRCNLLQLKNEENRLVPLRENIALYGVASRKLELYGNDWIVGSSNEEHVSLEHLLALHNIPAGDQQSNGLPERLLSRVNMLRESYLYNLCLENSDIKNYVTEKIWPAIYGYSLPLYYGSDSIYELFPKESFIDVREFNAIPELFDFLENLSPEEYLERLNRCITVVKNLEQTIQAYPSEGPSAQDIALDQIHSIYDKHYSYEN